jgi:hypothetical protein
MRPASSVRSRRSRFSIVVVALALAVSGVAVWRWRSGGTSPQAGSNGGFSPSPGPSGSPGGGEPGPINTAFPGLTTFRGNATRDYYGSGPMPSNPQVLWRYPKTGGLCAKSNGSGIGFHAGTKVWCGTGWTGQPNVIPNARGGIEVRIGAFDRDYHFLNGLTGKPLRPDLTTGDLAKGSATTDAQGYPLYYGGSRDNLLRVIALDRAKPTVLWSLDAMSAPNPTWNNDWDGAPLEVGDYLMEGGENSYFYIIKLNRRYALNGLVQVSPKVVMLVPGWDPALLQAIGDDDISIENSPAFDAQRGIVYFANSGGLVQGWDVSDLLGGGTVYRQVFRFWDGDDTDATIVVDPQGDLIVARHIEESFNRTRSGPTDRSIGSLMKLDPRNPANPVVWSVRVGSDLPDGGMLGTPAYDRGTIYALATDGELVAVEDQTGAVLWRMVGVFTKPTWMSPVAIGGDLLVGDCGGVLRDFDISDPSVQPRERWRVQLSGCIESTPAVWNGMIWVGTRGGAIYGIGDRK